MKKYFDVVASICDEYENRTDAHMVAGFETCQEARQYRTEYEKEIVDKHLMYCADDEHVRVDIEVRDEDGRLLWLE